MRSLIVIFGMMIVGLAIGAKESPDLQHVIDLKAINYPHSPCDYMFQVDSYPKNHIEFLDSDRLLVSFPADASNCDKKMGYTGRDARTFRSVVMDLSGRVLHSFDWGLDENVQAGPDGHILVVTKAAIRVLDSDFSLLQTIPGVWREHVRYSITLSPSRHGFAVEFHDYPTYRVIYFEGKPAESTQEAEDCRLAKVVDGGFLCRNPERLKEFTAHVNQKDRDWTAEDQLENQCWSGGILDKRWLLPGGPTWMSREDRYVSASGRVLCFTTGTRFPITDTSGFSYFLRIAVIDTIEKRLVFRKQYHIDSDVSLSPDGHWIAVREQTRLTLHRLD